MEEGARSAVDGGGGGAIRLRLPEELLSASIARAAPRDACRAAAVSPAFRAAADSDAVWARFLPREVPPLADGELSPAPPCKKALFMRLCDSPVLLADGLTVPQTVSLLFASTVVSCSTGFCLLG